MSQSEFFSKKDFSFSDTFTDIRPVYSSPTGHTEVYTARKALKRFALKALKPELRDDPFYVGLLRKEFEIGFRLEHPNIVHTYSFEKVDGLGLCIVLEWIEGETLAWHLSNANLDGQIWLKAATGLCDALEYLKTRQIVHQDVKPTNAMLTYDGNQLKLIDFGFADSPEYGSHKHSGGTPGYASPEQLSNSVIKSTSDIYALGKVLEILPIRKTKRIRSLIRRMCSERPDRRPRSAAEIKKELEKASARRPGKIFLLLLSTVTIAFAALIFIFQRENIPTVAADTEISENTEESKVRSVDTVRPVIPAVNTKRPAAENKKFNNDTILPIKTENPVSEGKDSSQEVMAPKRVVDPMIILTAQHTRSTARKLRESGDSLWELHTRQVVGEWVDSQTGYNPELNKDCHEEIISVIAKIKGEK